MKKILLLLQVLLVMSSFSSCIQDEPLNAECDIIAVDSLWLEQQMDIIVGKPIVTNDLVSFNIKRDADRTHLNPRFVLTDGARITMTLDGQELEANGVMRDFTSPQLTPFIPKTENGIRTIKFLSTILPHLPQLNCSVSNTLNWMPPAATTNGTKSTRPTQRTRAVHTGLRATVPTPLQVWVRNTTIIPPCLTLWA